MKPSDSFDYSSGNWNYKLFSLKELEEVYLSQFITFYSREPFLKYEDQVNFNYITSLSWKKEKQYLSQEDVILAYAEGVKTSLADTDSYIRPILLKYSPNTFRRLYKEKLRKALLDLNVTKRTAAIVVDYYLIGGDIWERFKEELLTLYEDASLKRMRDLKNEH